MKEYLVYKSLVTKEVIAVRGTTVPNEWGLPLIVARNPDKLWTLYETTSGSPLLRHKVRQMAIQGSLDQISNYGIDLTRHLIAKSIAKFGPPTLAQPSSPVWQE